MRTSPHPNVAYSYLRFSSPKQAKGDSIRRQTDLRDAWLVRNRVQLDTSITLRDEGKSAYTGEHRKNPDRHALAAFLKLVEGGRVPKGSYLIVENLDRLSREHIQPALILFLNLRQAGVRVVQLLPAEQVFDDKSESMAIMMAVMELSRGNSESRMKSERIGRAWAEKKLKAAAERTPLTKNLPAWLALEEGKIVPVPARAAVVKRVFALAAAGYGLVQIARTLTAEQVPTFGTSARWGSSTLHKILRWRAVLGEFQPRKKRTGEPDGEPIANYFPAVVTEREWWAAQAALSSRYGAAARPGPATACTSTRSRGPVRRPRRCENLRGDRLAEGPPRAGEPRGITGAAKYISFPLYGFVEAVLGELRELTVADVLGAGADDGDAAEVAELEGRFTSRSLTQP